MGSASETRGSNTFSATTGAGQATATDLPSDDRDVLSIVLSIVLAYVAERIETLWS